MVREYPIVGTASSSEDIFFLFSLNALIFPQFFPILSLVNFSYSVEFGNSFGKVWCFVLYFVSTLPFFDFAHTKKNTYILFILTDFSSVNINVKKEIKG